MDNSHRHAEMRAPWQRATRDQAAVRRQRAAALEHLPRPRLAPKVRMYVGDRLFDEDAGANMAATVAAREQLVRLRWKKDEGHYSLHTPYGTLDVWFFWRGCWTVLRHGAPLVQHDSPQATVFCGLAAAKAAALIHLADGFATSAPTNDGLEWKTDLPTAKTTVLQNPCDPPAAPLPPDDHEWGRHLDGLLQKSPDAGQAADAALIGHLEYVRAGWQLPPPTWTKRAHSGYELNTPYGILTIRRLIGWTAERNGVPLVWFYNGKRVIFDKLEHAKTIALVHALDHLECVINRTQWAAG
jgi:hypothetical protein